MRIYADSALLAKMLTDRTIMQARNVSSIPGIVEQSIVLPDGHEGYGFPVDGVAAMDAKEGMIGPGGVGYDINCGVRVLRSTLTEQQLRPNLKEIVNVTVRSQEVKYTNLIHQKITRNTSKNGMSGSLKLKIQHIQALTYHIQVNFIQS